MRKEFSRVAIVNRGEAAMRFVHAARELACQGLPLRTIALHTEPDRQALFVREADEDCSLGPAMFVDPRDGQRKSTYLDYARLEDALLRTRAEAVWVGWGFVAEHAEFADLCARLGIAFIGPPGDVMRRLGDKITSKKLAELAHVPVVAWSGGAVETLETAREHARRIGFPLMLKATSGGGGRGIRLLRSEDELPEAFQRARNEALKAFGDPTVFLERCAQGARHVEVQIIADEVGTTWALGVRDCTVQRRNQKVIEESPSPALVPETDAALRAAAVRLAREAGYRNAGTVEFLLDAATQQYWFMEVNARLQVEHPVTELTTGLDLVKLQVRVARGEVLEGEPPPVRGHAIEVRLNAEDPDAGFAPAPGIVRTFRFPGGPGLRVDTGVAEGDVIPQEFDSMLAKVIAWGRDRQEALARLRRALGQSQVVIGDGTTNKAFLLDLLSRPEIAASTYDVGWLDRLVATGELARRRHAEVALVRAAIESSDAEHDVELAQFLSSAARGRPAVRREIGHAVELGYGGQTYKFHVYRMAPDSYALDVDGQRVHATVQPLGRAPLRDRRGQGTDWRVTVGGKSHRVLLVSQGLRYVIEVDGVAHRVSRDNAGVVRAGGPSLVVSVAVAEGDEVEPGDRLLVLEAMKMEVAVTAPCGGRVRELRVTPNVQVGAGAPLLVIEPIEAGGAEAPLERVSFESLAADVPGGTTSEARVFDQLRSLMLGYDVDATSLKRLMTAWAAAPERELPPESALRCECDVLGIFVDVCSLFGRDPADADLGERGHVSAEEYLFTFLRTLDASGELLPQAFQATLRRAVSHYGVTGLTASDALRESLFRLFKAHQRADDHLAPILTLLERRLERAGRPAPTSTCDFRALLDRLITATQHLHPAVNDLARDVRYRYYEQPVLDRARDAVYASARADLDRLTADPHGAERDLHVQRLVDCPQPLASLLMGRFGGASPDGQAVMLEVLTRRYYRIREVLSVTNLAQDGQTFTTLDYAHEGRVVHVVAAYADVARVVDVIEKAAPLVAGFPAADDVALDLYTWWDGPLSDADRNEETVRTALNRATLPRPLHRVVVVVSGPRAGLGMGGMQHFTYVPADGGYREDKFFRNAHPMMGKRLHFWRLSNFDISRLPSPEDVYVIHAVAHDNPRDERIIAVAEVRDLTPVRDAAGRIVQLPQFERMLMEALGGVRRFQAKRPPERRLHWNRVLLYVWPPFTLRPDELNALVSRVVPATEGLGIEELFIRARVPTETGDFRDTVIAIGHPDTNLTVSYREPPSEPMRSLSGYEQKVVRSRQQGVVYPYELVRMLTVPRDHVSAGVHDFPAGEFFEYDLDADHQLVPTSRPPGHNTSNIVVGVIRNFTRKYPEGMTRVVLLGDPTRDLGALAEPECRRIIAALDLAEQKRVPLEWFALSAGAKISMDSGTENMDWIALVLRRIVRFTQQGGEINVVVNGINVGAQPYWNAEATMLMHTRGILVMTPESAMVLTGKRALDYSGGVSAEDNQGIGGYERIMGPNGQGQYFARDMAEACRLLLRYYDHTHVSPGERFPRRAATTDPTDRDVCVHPYGQDHHGFATVGDVFSDERNPGRKRPFDIRRVMAAVVDQDHRPLERWVGWRDAENAVVWDCHLGGYPVSLVGIESHPLQRFGFVPADGPDQWTAGTLFPQSSRKVARAVNAASGNRPLIVLANLSGFDGSPESLRLWQLEYGAEIGRAVVNFTGPLVFCVVSRYHGGAFVVFSNALNPNLEIAALEGTYASVIGGAPAAAVVFAREVERRTAEEPQLQTLDRQMATADGAERARLRAHRAELVKQVRSAKLGEVAEEFDRVHSVRRAQQVGSVHHIIEPTRLRPYLVDAIDRGIRREMARLGRERQVHQ
jgi:acetyl/propionyl-CoA carboxylase alpha subunit/acetyl-CoA carboxylase carboxyltransferase component